MSTKSVFCVAASHSQAERIVAQLKTANFASREISSLYPDADTAHGSAHVLLSVGTDNPDEISRVKAIFADAGADDICTSGEADLADVPVSTAPLSPSPSSVRYSCPA